MSNTTLERDKKIIESLTLVMKLYRGAIEIKYENQERLILQYIQSVTSHHPELVCIEKACQRILEQYPKGMPHDSTLLDEAMKLVNHPYRRVFPDTLFDQDVLIYKMYDHLIKDEFDKIPREGLSKVENFMIDRLWNGVHSTLVENRNFQGDNPYYKRNYRDMQYSKKTWLKILDEDFNNLIDYFNEPIEEEIV
ncbi:hypothetical protein CVD28_02525 [Bacillus sp. M6-12]|uniref:hypothetical protein n=1 Tax=Bacillus sp. M6-12 TaxID=2054166 RepID=UPI000C76F1B4|nr:hypothetical protein [Bacillus sp. M6-12]PLS19307.1 hypothetical protein CVD28_02525 [Bacillus sp. M6-12]